MPATTTTTRETLAADKLSTAEEVADFLRVSPWTLAQWRSRGKGPRFVRVGRLARYRPADVETFLREHEGQGFNTGLTYGA